jgi:hypothetical protein
MIAKIGRPLVVFAVIGWVLTFLMSLAPFVGIDFPASASDASLFVLFPLMLAAVIMVNWRVAGRILTPGLIWTDAIESSPAGLRYAVFGTMLYAFGLFCVRFLNVFVPGTSVTMAMLSCFYALAALALCTASRPTPDPNSSRLRAN